MSPKEKSKQVISFIFGLDDNVINVPGKSIYKKKKINIKSLL